jgi:two-component system response regulator YesN
MAGVHTVYKLMVVDDEYNIRDGIANAIPWADHNIEVAAQASNAMEAISKFEQFQPDIIITDIIMDDMTGLDMIEHLYRKNQNIKVIIISGYDDFEYAKRAIKLKAASYLLKPIVPDELTAIADNLVKDIADTNRIKEKLLSLEDELKQGRAYILEKFLNDLIYGRITDEKELNRRAVFLGLRFDYPSYLCLSFSVDNYFELAGKKPEKDMQIIILGVKKVITEIFCKKNMVFVLEENGSDITAVIGSSSIKDSLMDEIHANIEKIKDMAKELFDITVTVGLGRVYDNILNIRRSYMEAGKAIEYRIVAGKDTVIDIEDIASISGKSYIYPKDKEKQILNSISENDEEKIACYVDGFFKDLLSQNCLKRQIQAVVFQLIMGVSGKLIDMGMDQEEGIMEHNMRLYDKIDRLETVEDIKTYMTREITRTANDIFLRRNGDVRNIIAKSQKYISDHFTDSSISLQTISEHIHLSPAYFSKLYKKETGDSYIDYVTKVRIDMAKKYLKETNMRISEVGASVGYLNSHYFSTLFKKYAGITPAEYRML